MQLTDWLLVEVALLLIGLTQISFAKNWFWPSRKRSAVFCTATKIPFMYSRARGEASLRPPPPLSTAGFWKYILRRRVRFSFTSDICFMAFAFYTEPVNFSIRATRIQDFSAAFTGIPQRILPYPQGFQLAVFLSLFLKGLNINISILYFFRK